MGKKLKQMPQKSANAKKLAKNSQLHSIWWKFASKIKNSVWKCLNMHLMLKKDKKREKDIGKEARNVLTPNTSLKQLMIAIFIDKVNKK